MICNRKNGKRHWIISFLFVIILFCLTSPIQAQTKQFQKAFTIGGKLSAAVIIVDAPKGGSSTEALVTLLIEKANSIYKMLDSQDPESEVAKINNSAGDDGVTVSNTTLAAFKAAQDVSTWTDGVFDITQSENGNWKKIKINEKDSTVRVKSKGMKVGFDRIISGFLADTLTKELSSAGVENAVVKVGYSFSALGHAEGKPWAIAVEVDEAGFARHAINMTITNSGVSTVSAKDLPNPPCRGVSILMKNAAHAEGMARAIFKLGPKKGYEFCSKIQNMKGIIVDNNGVFIRSPGY